MDLSLLRLPTFPRRRRRGFVYRVGAGALPFLLPMMLQVGFTRRRRVGLITFATASAQ